MQSMPEICGDNILLREFRQEDIGPDYLSWLNDPRVVRYSNQRFRKHDRASAQAYLDSFPGTSNLFVSIRHRASGRAIGTMTAYVNNHHQTADVGILLGDPAVQGKGFGYESWRLLCDWLLAERGIRKLTAGTSRVNVPMVSIMERYGMVREAVLKDQEIMEGHPADILLYARFMNA